MCHPRKNNVAFGLKAPVYRHATGTLVFSLSKFLFDAKLYLLTLRPDDEFAH